MKRIITFLITLILVLSLTSCWGSKDKNVDEIQKEPSVVEIQNEIAEVYETASKGCVGIYATTDEKGAIGSGVVYKKVNGLYYVVTNSHVVEDMNDYRIYRGGSKYYPAKLVGNDPKNDIAVLTFSLDFFGNADIYIHDIFNYVEDSVKIGQTTLAIGCPLSMDYYNTLSTGVISGIAKGKIQTNTELNPGNSGGGLFNIAGRLIGINTEKEVYATSENEKIPVEGIGFAISLDVVKKCILDIESKKGVIDRPLLGVTVVSLNRWVSSGKYEAFIQYLPNSMDEGLVIEKIVDGIAKEGGLIVYDVILEIDGHEIFNIKDLSYYFNLKMKGDTVVLKIYRPSLKKTQNITLAL